MSTGGSATASPSAQVDARSLAIVAVMTLIWGCNWPMLKIGVSELQPLTFRALTLPLSAVVLLLIALTTGGTLKVPRSFWPKLAVLALFNITAWNGLILFGLREMSAGRSSILAYTMPVWAVLLSVTVMREPLGLRKAIGLLLGMAAMLLLLGDDIAAIERSPTGTLLILAAAVSWGVGTIMMRHWRTDLPQTTLIGWMMLIGWIPLGLAAPLLDANMGAGILALSPWGWTAVLYNIFLAGIVSHWAWFTLARTLPVAVSSLSSLPVPVMGVMSGMVVLGERPGAPEYAALVLVALALATLYWPARESARP